MAPFIVTFVVEIILEFFIYTFFSNLIFLPIEVLLFKIFYSFYVKTKNENSAVKIQPGANGAGNQTMIEIDSQSKVDQGHY